MSLWVGQQLLAVSPKSHQQGTINKAFEVRHIVGASRFSEEVFTDYVITSLWAIALYNLDVGS